jgi:hypothetical protein
MPRACRHARAAAGPCATVRPYDRSPDCPRCSRFACSRDSSFACSRYSSFACSRRTNFCTFPVEVFGSSQNTTVRGTL